MLVGQPGRGCYVVQHKKGEIMQLADGFDERGRFNPLLAMKAQQELIDKLGERIKFLEKRLADMEDS